jgi:hypothetical protein
MREVLPRAEGLAEPTATLVLAAAALLAWVFGKPKPRLVFTEAEVHFLFAAPATRRQVIRYRLAKGMLQGLLVAALVAVIFGRATRGSAVALAVATWMALSALDLHAIGASFVRAWLHERISGGQLQAIRVVALAALAGAVGWAVREGSLTVGPLSWLLWPAKAVVRPAMAADFGALLWALPPAVLVLVCHYLWVLVAAERFEDAAVEAAERAARRIEALRAGGVTAVILTGKSRPVPFRLPASAGPEVALAWKGLIAVSRSLVLPIIGIVVLSMAGAVAMIVIVEGPAARLGEVVGFLAAPLLFLVLFLGPAFTGGGLATELGRLDFLRTLPLPGARIVLGQALAPALLLVCVWIALVPPAAFLFPGGLGLLERTCLALALAMVGPPLLLLGVLLQASLVVALPGWMAAGLGPLAIGRTMLASVVQFIGLPLLSLPAAIAGAVLVAVGHRLAGWPAIPVAGAATAALLIGEIALAVGIIGRAFESLDPSEL